MYTVSYDVPEVNFMRDNLKIIFLIHFQEVLLFIMSYYLEKAFWN